MFLIKKKKKTIKYNLNGGRLKPEINLLFAVSQSLTPAFFA